MPRKSTERTRRLKGRIGIMSRWGHHAEADEARRELAYAILEDEIADTLNRHQPSPDQRDRLVALLSAPEPTT